MRDDAREPDNTVAPELQPVVARLQEIHRKCLSLGPRNEEARDMAVRLERVISALAGDPGGDAPRPALGDLARDLFPAARLFESLGFMSVARELSHVEKTLVALDPAGAAGRSATPGGAYSARVQSAIAPEDEDSDAGDTAPPVVPESARSRRVSTPVAVAVLAVLIAVAGSVAIVRRQQARYQSAAATLRPTAFPTMLTPTSGPAQVPISTPGPSPTAATPTPGPRARLASALSDARLAQRDGDLDRAVSLLSQAALIDSTANQVVETARSLASDLLARADGAAAAASWDEAAEYVERARELAIRFELPTEPMDAAVRRHARLERYEKVAPTDVRRLEALAGHRVIVVTREDQRHEGQMHAVAGSTLELHQGIDVGRGGTLFHVQEIPLADIVEVRVYPD